MSIGRWVGIVFAAITLISTAWGVLLHGLPGAKPQPMTLDQCRDWARNSDTVREVAGKYAPGANLGDVIEVTALRCQVDHDPATHELPRDRQIEITVQKFCTTKAAELWPGEAPYTQKSREGFISQCVPLSIQKAQETWKKFTTGK